MQIYVNHKGERLGPFTFYQISELLNDGKLSPDDLGWHQGRDEWTPLREIPSLMSTIEAKRERDFQRESSKPLDTATGSGSDSGAASSPPRAADEAQGAAAGAAPPESPGSVQVRPFTRFWARIFDQMLLVLVVFAIFGPPPGFSDAAAVSPAEVMDPAFWDKMREAMESPEGRRWNNIQYAAFVIWVMVEGLMLARFGATPGKALFGIRVARSGGSRISVQQGLMRSILVWFIGVGFWFPLLTVFTLTFSLYYLLSRRTTVWDRQARTRVIHRPLTAVRMLLVIFAFLAILLTQQALTLR